MGYTAWLIVEYRPNGHRETVEINRTFLIRFIARRLHACIMYDTQYNMLCVSRFGLFRVRNIA